MSVRQVVTRGAAPTRCALFCCALLSLPALLAGCKPAPSPEPPVAQRTIVLGFDGLDPELTERWMAAGVLPNFARLAQQGHYQRLATTNPPQSPVAWATFATGANPGKHGIFDFLARDPATYRPDFSIATVLPPEHNLELFGYRLPLSDPIILNRRQGEPFWSALEARGMKSSVLRVPVTFPPDAIHRMLSGMGVPDLLGTQGTYTFVTSDTRLPVANEGRVLPVRLLDGVARTRFEGPPHPLKPASGALWLPLEVRPVQGMSGVEVTLGDDRLSLKVGQWSDWRSVAFGFAPRLAAKGVVRMYLIEGFPDLKLYISPINLDPREPAMPISSPRAYAAELVTAIGSIYHTLGMAEETWSLNAGRMTDDGYLAMVRTVLGEREAIFFDTLKRRDSALVVMVFVQPDRISHMFWRGIDPEHPLYAETGPAARGAIEWIYRESDRILGRTLAEMREGDKLIVLSDHGFAPFRRAVNLNRWLIQEKLLATLSGRTAAELSFGDIDWKRTKAYALGLNGVYINRRGREAGGIVDAAEAEAIKTHIRDALPRLTDRGAQVVKEVYDAAAIYQGAAVANAPDLVIGYTRGYRASWQTALGGAPAALVEDNRAKWSGDHCIDPTLVPGILFTSFPLAQPVAGIANVAQLAGTSLGVADVFAHGHALH